ncbi:MAG: hypothetical protein KJ650_03800 [Firmicutes bacterium]|nr:hypothetical protein [Bacillota bacterium]MBV1727690.1 hypothetical protein [Desulforudis sp.]MBU4532752.1 hypothetical protein [Bacillota bacterium]MBU4554587.1 hypothetical protein [Bacillota bacterium]MBV1736255.1 hypothetical protein [Desulforudis sp.]
MKKEFDFFDRPKNQLILFLSFIGLLILLLGLDFFVDKHPYFGWDGIPVFYAFYGFVGCVLLVVIAKNMRPFIKREEDYYDDK